MLKMYIFHIHGLSNVFMCIHIIPLLCPVQQQEIVVYLPPFQCVGASYIA